MAQNLRGEFMIEAIGMITVLAGMGIYFVKSTDLPKDLRERQNRNQHSVVDTSFDASKKRYAFPGQNKKVENKITKADFMNELELKLKKQKLIEAKNKKIDELTILITALEQELKDNLLKNAEIQAKIDKAMAELIELKNSVIA